ncbi:MAG TPA: intradiol ring-cleavage dioxygenase [Methylomirabilota bacterium]
MTMARLLAAAVIAVALGALPVRAQSPCAATRPDALGPFYQANAPERAQTGKGFVVTGAVRSANGCQALAAARLEWWSADARGDYNDEHRATQRTDAEGRFRYETDFPGKYPGRPPHLHVRITASGHRPLVTQLYPSPGQGTVAADFVLVPE